MLETDDDSFEDWEVTAEWETGLPTSGGYWSFVAAVLGDREINDLAEFQAYCERHGSTLDFETECCEAAMCEEDEEDGNEGEREINGRICK